MDDTDVLLRKNSLLSSLATGREFLILNCP